MDMGRENIQVVQHTKVTGSMENFMVKVLIHGQTEKPMKGSGKTMCIVDLGN
jgi:hypothetical protein